MPFRNKKSEGNYHRLDRRLNMNNHVVVDAVGLLGHILVLLKDDWITSHELIETMWILLVPLVIYSIK